MAHLHKFKFFAFLAGFLLSFGISYAGMINPNKILAFLDVTGNWDPTLLVVLGGAVGVTLITFRFVMRLPKPLLHHQFVLPTLTRADRPLIICTRLCRTCHRHVVHGRRCVLVQVGERKKVKLGFTCAQMDFQPCI
jgi:hypothetical protein